MINTVAFRAIHLILAMIIVFGVYPFRKKVKSTTLSLIDISCITLAIIVGVYMVVQWPEMVLRQGEPTRWDIILGIVAVLLTIEMARRTTGWALPLVSVFFLAYSYWGPYFPGSFSHVGFPIDRLVGQLYTTTEGIYGLPLGVMVNYVFLFILFAGFLQKSGAGEFLIELSYALTGRFRGGPAKTAVVASGLLATITGAATANVVATGSFTIPLMKKVGYKPETAGGIETAASVGGQLTPPIMGAGAFIMSEWTGIPYLKIIAIALAPALIYYFSVGFYVHLLACKMGLKPLRKEEIPPLWPVFKKGFHLFTPLIVLTGMLIWGYTPMTSVIYAIASLLIAANLRKESRMGIKTIIEALEQGSKSAVLVSASLACAGIIMCTIGLTGVGLKFSSIVLQFSGGNILLALVLVAIASLFLGMELPITAAYITCAVLAVPALTTMGVPLIVAHMIVFWFSMDSSITPPVCITAYAAAGISGGSPIRTGMAAWKMSKALYILPIVFATTNMLTGSPVEIILISIPTVVALASFSMAWEGFFLRKMNAVERVLLAVTTITCLYPHLIGYLIGGSLFIVVLVSQRFCGREERSEVAVLL
jgi:TRAP transporter 4TM/12TM fusion protein